MKKVFKWVAIVGGALIVLVIAALIIIPMFVDVQKFKPQIEEWGSEVTGRPFAIDGELNLSLFPWIGLGFSGLHLGNPAGFQEKDFLSIKSFEVRVKLFPLLSKDIQVKRFILEEPRIVLEKSKKGKGNWEGIGKPSEPPKEKKEIPETEPQEGLPIAALAINEFAITKGSVIWIDHGKGERQEISDLTLRLKDVSLDRPIPLVFSAKLDGRPLSLEGKVGPLGKDPGKGTIPLDLAIKAMKQMDMSLKGKIVDPATRPQFDLVLQISPFSPRKLVAALGQTFPIATTDPKALSLMAFKANLKGDPANVSVSDGLLELDDSKLNFSAKAKDFSKPDLTFNLNLDKIDLDRYLSPPSKKPAEEKKAKTPSPKGKKAKSPTPKKKKTDYTPLRRLVLDGTIRIGNLKAHGAKIQDLYLKVSAKNGRFNLNPITLKLYQGDASAKGVLDVRKNIPKTNMTLRIKGVQAGPLLRDLLKKDFLEGTLKADVSIRMKGDDAEKIKKTLNGKGDFLFTDGAIKGIDLAGMVRNAKAAFGLAEKGGEKPRTDFSEFHSPFTITNGVVNTPKTSLKSPLFRVLAAGDANLVQETLDFRVEPKFVGSIKGQGDATQRSGITVPVLVTGNFSSPKFRPDLEGMLKQTLEKGITDPSQLQKLLPGETTEKGEPEPLEEKVKGLLKGLFGQ